MIDAISKAPSIQKSKLAKWSFISGILSITSGLLYFLLDFSQSNPSLWLIYLFGACILPFAVIAIVLGIIALANIKHNPGIKGKGMAIAGLIIGGLITLYVLVCICIIYVVLRLGGL